MAGRNLIARLPTLILRRPSPLPLVRRLQPLAGASIGPAAAAGVRRFSTRPTTSSLNDPSPNWSNRPPKETILLDGCDFEHWLVVMEPPDPNLTRDEIIDSYIKTLAQVIGSEDEARMKIYSVSTKHYFAFGALVSEELSYKIKTLPKVRWVLPDSYLDVKNKDYGGEPFIDGKAVPYDPRYHEEWVRNNARANERSRRNDRPRNFDRSRNFERRRENMQTFQNRDMPPMQNQNPQSQQSPMPPRDMPPMPNQGPQNTMPPPMPNAMPPRDAPNPAGMPPPMPNRDFGGPNRDYQSQPPSPGMPPGGNYSPNRDPRGFPGGQGYQGGGGQGYQGGLGGGAPGGPSYQGYQGGGPGRSMQGGGPDYQGGGPGYQGGGTGYQGGGPGYPGGSPGGNVPGPGYPGSSPGGNSPGPGYQGNSPGGYQGGGGGGYQGGGGGYQGGGGGYQGGGPNQGGAPAHQERDMPGRDYQ